MRTATVTALTFDAPVSSTVSGLTVGGAAIRHRGQMRSRRSIPAFVAAVVLGLAACGSGGADGPPADTAAAAIDLTFTATTVDGAPFEAASLVDEPAVLWFWAPWCPTCVAEAPDVLDVAERHAGQVAVIGVAGLGSGDEMRRFISLTQTSGLTHLADEDGAVWRRFEVIAQSSYVLLDTDGTIAYSGFLSGDDLARRVAELTS